MRLLGEKETPGNDATSDPALEIGQPPNGDSADSLTAG
jgi:hypothetical protein